MRAPFRIYFQDVKRLSKVHTRLACLKFMMKRYSWLMCTIQGTKQIEECYIGFSFNGFALMCVASSILSSTTRAMFMRDCNYLTLAQFQH